jgi:hypothetical protein
MGGTSRRTEVIRQGKKERSYLKDNLKQKGVEIWLNWYSKHKALSSNPNTAKEKNSYLKRSEAEGHLTKLYYK